MTVQVDQNPERMTGRVKPGDTGEVRVVFIAGSSRTGSTIMANILGQLDGCFAVGELWNLWRRSLIEHRRCGCGVPVPECEVWQQILRRSFAGRIPDDAEARRLDELTHRHIRARDTRAAWSSFGRPVEGEPDDYRRTLLRLYRSIKRVTGCEVIIDSSKEPVYGLLLAGLPGLRVSVVHLIRDPRAVAFSHGRRVLMRDFGDGRLMPRERTWVGARRWLKSQTLSGVVLPRRVPDYRMVQYGEFASNPRAAIARLSTLAGDELPLPFLDERTAMLETTHSVSGNPKRFDTGPVRVGVDDEWRTRMPARDKLVVTAVTWPLLLRYGYTPWPRRDQGSLEAAGQR
ncbi:MAG: sulfotransferase [Marmoricola sp.]